jgi:hypothetical protein
VLSLPEACYVEADMIALALPNPFRAIVIVDLVQRRARITNASAENLKLASRSTCSVSKRKSAPAGCLPNLLFSKPILKLKANGAVRDFYA